MEDLFEEYGICNDQDKKKKLGKYADQQTEFEWKAFKEFEDGIDFAEFKKALIVNYPEAQMTGKGTLTALNNRDSQSRRFTRDSQCDSKRDS